VVVIVISSWFEVVKKQEISFSIFLEDSPKMASYFEENFEHSMSYSPHMNMNRFPNNSLLSEWIVWEEYQGRTDIGKIFFNILFDIIKEENLHVVARHPDDLYGTPLLTLQQWETHIPKIENKTDELRRLVAKKQLDKGEWEMLIGKPHGRDPKDLDEEHRLWEAEK
jgi:hypothetical protein